MTEGPRVGVIGVPGGWSTERLADRLEERTGFRRVIEMSRVVVDSGSGEARAGGLALETFDGLVVKKLGAAYGPELLDALRVLAFIETRGVRIFSSPTRLRGMLDRVSCTLSLREHDVPMPPTCLTADPGEAAAAVRRYGRAVLKPIYSTKGQGILPVSADEDLDAAFEKFGAAPGEWIYVQQREELSGRDLGVGFVDGRHVGTYARVAGEGAWNTTIHSGGHYEPFDADPAVVALAKRAQDVFGLDFASVDVALTPGGPCIFEVSAFGGFRGLLEGCGVDAAEAVAELVVERLAGSGGG